ncbi:hypothetical protein ScPMuIL_015387 [Solemya velum]
MRRSHIGNGYQAPQPVPSHILEDENSRLEDELSGKVGALKHLTIEIGHEVREQNKLLKDMDDDFNSTGGLLSSSMYMQAWDNIKNTELGNVHTSTAGEIAASLVTSGNYKLLEMFVSEMDRKKIQMLKQSDKFFRALIALSFHTKDYGKVYRLLEEWHFPNKSGLLEIWDEAHYMEKEESVGKALTPLIRFRLRKRHPPPSSISPDGIRPTLKLSERSRGILQGWLHEHSDKPYPDTTVRVALAKRAGLSVCQVKTWFANARRRKKKLEKITSTTKTTRKAVADKHGKGTLKNEPSQSSSPKEEPSSSGSTNKFSTPKKHDSTSISDLLFSPSSDKFLFEEVPAQQPSSTITSREPQVTKSVGSLPPFSTMFDCSATPAGFVSLSPSHLTTGYEIPVHRGREREPTPSFQYPSSPYNHFQPARTWQHVGEASGPGLWQKPPGAAYQYSASSGLCNGCTSSEPVVPCSLGSPSRPPYRWYASPLTPQNIRTAPMATGLPPMEYTSREHMVTLTPVEAPVTRVMPTGVMENFWTCSQTQTPSGTLSAFSDPQRCSSYFGMRPDLQMNGSNHVQAWSPRMNLGRDGWFKVPCQPDVYYPGQRTIHKPEPVQDVAQALLDLSAKPNMGVDRLRLRIKTKTVDLAKVRWAILHPENWTVNEVSGWLESVAEEHLIRRSEQCELLGLFTDINGQALLSMTSQDFEDLSPKHGKLLHNVLKRLCESAPHRRSISRTNSKEEGQGTMLTAIVEGKETDSPPKSDIASAGVSK